MSTKQTIVFIIVIAIVVYLANQLVYGQELNTTKQLKEQILQEFNDAVNDAVEKDLNITDIENVSEQELRIKMFIYFCNDPERWKTGIDPEVLKHQCDIGMKVLRDRGLIE